MFLTITTTGSAGRPATDLGFLLHKHPEKAQTFSTSYGNARVFYPEASAERCTAALLLEVDPVALVKRGRGKGRGGAPDSALAQYVTDRPYAASSLLAEALPGTRMTTLAVPDLSLVVLVGTTGSGKSTFARRHFKPTEVISSDVCRGLVADDFAVKFSVLN